MVKAAATVVEMAADENSWQNKKTSTPGVEVFAYQLITVVILGEAVSAVNRTVTGGTERNLCFNAAARAGSIVHFALGTAVAATAETTVVLFTSFSKFPSDKLVTPKKPLALITAITALIISK